MRYPGRRRKVKGKDYYNNNSKKRKNLWTHKIRRKYLRPSQVSGKCQKVQVKRSQSKLNVEHPTIVKWLMKSHFTFLALPRPFCRAHLPAEDTIVTLETDTGEQYETKFLPRCCTLSAGWRRFDKANELEVGDAVVLQLVEATKFKVYFIRENSTNEDHLPFHHLNLVDLEKRSVSRKADSNQLSINCEGEVHQIYLKGKQKQFRTDEIGRKDLRLTQVVGKSQLVQDERIQSKLIFEHPAATVKWLQKSHVSYGFLMGLSPPFCRAHLPVEDTIMILETETGEHYETKYLPRHYALSGGWRRFAKEKKLEVGDGVVFHLVEATKFKVYIIRVNADEENLPVHLLDYISHVEQSVSSKADSKQLIGHRSEVHQIGWKSARLNSKYVESSMLLCGGVLFNNITSFEEFKAIISELIQNHTLPHYTLHDYYGLCRSQNAFLHAHLFRGMSNNQSTVKAIRKIIIDTVNIANALRTCKLSTFLSKYTVWDKALKSYAALGMNVSFLCARLHHLRNLAVSSEGAIDISRYREACHERGRAKGEVRKLELIHAKLQTLNFKHLEEKYREGNACPSWLAFAKAEISDLEVLIAEFGNFFSQYDAHIDTLKLKAETHELKFQEEVSAPW